MKTQQFMKISLIGYIVLFCFILTHDVKIHVFLDILSSGSHSCCSLGFSLLTASDLLFVCVYYQIICTAWISVVCGQICVFCSHLFIYLFIIIIHFFTSLF